MGIENFTAEDWTSLGNFLAAQPVDINTFVRQNYPQVAWALSNPEVGPIIRQAALEKWDAARLMGALEKTTWWSTTDAAQREWQRVWAEDPASGQTKLNDAALNVSSVASSLGVRLDAQQLNDLSIKTAAEGWDRTRVTQEIMRNATYDPNGTGDVNGMVNQIRDRASQYLMPMSDQTSFGWAKNILTGAATKDGLDAYLRDIATKRFAGDSTVTDALGAGATLKDIFDPYVQQTAQLLELSPDMISLMDPKYSQMIDARQSDGNRRPMTLSEAAEFIRSTDDWKTTDQANKAAASFGEQILKTFGKVA